MWHFIAANIGPGTALVRFCDPGESETGGPLIDGIVPDGTDQVGELETIYGRPMQTDGKEVPAPLDVRRDMRADFNTLNGQGKDLCLQRLRDVGHDPVFLGLAKPEKVGKGKTRKAA